MAFEHEGPKEDGNRGKLGHEGNWERASAERAKGLEEYLWRGAFMIRLTD